MHCILINIQKVSEEKDIKEETVGKGQKRKKAATPAKTAAKKKRKVDDTEAIKEDAAEDSAEAESTEDEKMGVYTFFSLSKRIVIPTGGFF